MHQAGGDGARSNAMGGTSETVDLVHSMFELADVGLAVLDVDLNIVRINSRLADLLGVGRDGPSAKELVQRFPKHAGFIQGLARSALETGHATRPTELFGGSAGFTGNARWFANGWPLTDGERVVGVGVRFHTTAQRGVEDAL